MYEITSILCKNGLIYAQSSSDKEDVFFAFVTLNNIFHSMVKITLVIPVFGGGDKNICQVSRSYLLQVARYNYEWQRPPLYIKDQSSSDKTT